MKRKTVIIIICCVTLAVISIVGIFLVKEILGKTYDFVLDSMDKSTSFTLKKACRSEPERNLSYQAFFAELLDENNFFDEYVSSHPSYLYSVDDRNQISKESTGNYLFFENGHYYYISVRNGEIYGAELILSVPYSSFSEAFAPFPFIKNESHIDGGYGYLPYGTHGEYSWKDAPGISSMEDLVAYYQRIPGFQIEIDASAKTILLPLQTWNESLSLIYAPEKVQIQEVDGKIVVRYLGSNE